MVGCSIWCGGPSRCSIHRTAARCGRRRPRGGESGNCQYCTVRAGVVCKWQALHAQALDSTAFCPLHTSGPPQAGSTSQAQRKKRTWCGKSESFRPGGTSTAAACKSLRGVAAGASRQPVVIAMEGPVPAWRRCLQGCNRRTGASPGVAAPPACGRRPPKEQGHSTRAFGLSTKPRGQPTNTSQPPAHPGTHRQVHAARFRLVVSSRLSTRSSTSTGRSTSRLGRAGSALAGSGSGGSDILLGRAVKQEARLPGHAEWEMGAVRAWVWEHGRQADRARLCYQRS